MQELSTLVFEIFTILFEILTLLILSTALFSGWWLLWTWRKGDKALNGDLVTLEAVRFNQEAIDDFKEELAPIKTQLNQIQHLIQQQNNHEN